jgi:HEAT repeat protein
VSGDDPTRAALGALLDPHGGPHHAADRERAGRALLALGDRGHAAVVEALTDAPNWGSTALIRLLPRFERADDVPRLAAILLDGPEPQQIVAAQALAEHPDQTALVALLDALNGAPEVAVFAAQALAQRGDPAACSRLREVAGSDAAPEWVRRAAADAEERLVASGEH